VAYILSMQFRKPVEVADRCDSGFDRARHLFQECHSFEPPRVIRTNCRRLIPDVLVNLGELRGLIYRSDKGQCGQPRTFIHFMDTPPRLACDESGRQLYIVGGKYQVTSRGIEG